MNQVGFEFSVARADRNSLQRKIGDSMPIVPTYMQYSTARYLHCYHCLISKLLDMYQL